MHFIKEGLTPSQALFEYLDSRVGVIQDRTFLDDQYPYNISQIANGEGRWVITFRQTPPLVQVLLRLFPFFETVQAHDGLAQVRFRVDQQEVMSFDNIAGSLRKDHGERMAEMIPYGAWIILRTKAANGPNKEKSYPSKAAFLWGIYPVERDRYSPPLHLVSDITFSRVKRNAPCLGR